MSSPMEMAISTKYITKKEVESVKKEILDLKGQISHFKALYQSMKEKIAEIKSKNNIISNNDLTKRVVYGNNTPEKAVLPEKIKINGGIMNQANENLTNGHHVKQKHDAIPIPPLNDTTEFADENGIITVPLLYGVIKRNAKKIEFTNNGLKLKGIERNIKHDNITEPQMQTSETYMHKKKRACKKSAEAENMVPIGSGQTTVPKKIYDEIVWNSYTMATRKLLMAVFSRRVLATHSLTGKPSPAFINKPAKHCLDPKKVSDVIHEVTKRCKVKENLVRNAITTKCADENKMMKIKAKKRNITM